MVVVVVVLSFIHSFIHCSRKKRKEKEFCDTKKRKFTKIHYYGICTGAVL